MEIEIKTRHIKIHLYLKNKNNTYLKIPIFYVFVLWYFIVLTESHCYKEKKIKPNSLKKKIFKNDNRIIYKSLCNFHISLQKDSNLSPLLSFAVLVCFKKWPMNNEKSIGTTANLKDTKMQGWKKKSVSYTHLTLPTKA